VYEGQASPLRVLSVVRDEGFKLGDRAAHVYSEADRVYSFRAAAEVRGRARVDGRVGLMGASVFCWWGGARLWLEECEQLLGGP